MDLANPILKSRAWKRYWGSFDMIVPPRCFPRASPSDDGHSFRGGCDRFPFWLRPPLAWAPLPQCHFLWQEENPSQQSFLLGNLPPLPPAPATAPHTRVAEKKQ